MSNKAEDIRGIFKNVEAWHEVGDTGEPAFQNSWVNRANNRTVAFYKDPFGVVHLKGAITGVTNGTVVFTLPEGYRPSARIEVAGVIMATDLFTVIRIAPTGDVTSYGGNINGSSLESISFRADQ